MAICGTLNEDSTLKCFRKGWKKRNRSVKNGEVVNVNVVGLNVKGKVESQASQDVHNSIAMITVKYFILYKLIAL